MLFKKSKTRVFLFRKTIGSNTSFTVIEKNQVFKIAMFELKETVHYGLWEESGPLIDPESIFEYQKYV